MALDMTTFAGALKQHYLPLTVKNLVYKNNPFFAAINKYNKFGGLNTPLPLIYGNPQGRSATFANALAQKTNSQIKAFTLTRVSDYSLANVSNEVLEASLNDSDAFMRAATTEINGAFQSLTRSLATGLFGSGTGTIGIISAGSTVASKVITLATIADVTNFEIGMTLQASATDGGVVRTGSAIITGIDRNLGTLTTTAANWSTSITGLLVGDFLSVAGDLNAKISGLAAWLPYGGPSATSFFGVDRTVDSVRLGGISLDQSGVPIEEALVSLAGRISREGGVPDTCFMNFETFINLEKSLGSKVAYTYIKSPDADISFKGISIHGPKGPINVVPDQNCPSSYVYMLQMDTWCLYSLGDAPKLLNSDGLEFLRISSADSIEVRTGYYAQLGCVAPGWNGVAKIA